ncbi:MAG: hypothetical protein LBM19_02785 [Holosporales bacterium]|nr:hypothetical protein [Holosporales bacterium]
MEYTKEEVKKACKRIKKVSYGFGNLEDYDDQVVGYLKMNNVLFLDKGEKYILYVGEAAVEDETSIKEQIANQLLFYKLRIMAGNAVYWIRTILFAFGIALFIWKVYRRGLFENGIIH